jgi:hypothetical protein
MKILPYGLVLAAFAQQSSSDTVGAPASSRSLVLGSVSAACASMPMPVDHRRSADSMPMAHVDTSRLAPMPVTRRGACVVLDSARFKPIP